MIATVPVYESFEWSDFKVTVKPRGIRKCLPILPYFTGSGINLSLSFETISGNQREFAYHWKCYYVGADDVAQGIETGHASFLDDPQKKATTVIKVKRLSYQGFYRIEVWIAYPINDRKGSPSKTVVDFYTTDRDAITIKALFALVALLGIGFGAFIKWLLG